MVYQVPTQILNQSKQVWKWSVESGNGKTWLYFIFAICQWLPTNDRFNHDDAFKRQCHLCLTGAKDGLEHILVCPALAAENSLFKILRSVALLIGISLSFQEPVFLGSTSFGSNAEISQ
jgi:hypothetical protein